MNTIKIHIDPQVLEDAKKTKNGHSTSEGIFMLGLENNSENILAGNKYINALETVRFLMKQLGIEGQLYE